MRRRRVRVLIIAVVVLAAVLVAADRLTVRYAQNRAAQQIRTSQHLTSTPAVRIKGFPFLTQVAGRRLDEVTVSATGVETTGSASGGELMRISRLDADLHGVELSGNFQNFVADSATGSALVTYADLSAAAPAGATVTYGGSGRVKVTFTVPLAGLHRSALAAVSVSGGDTLRLQAKSLPKTGIAMIDRLIEGRTHFARTLYGLPSGIRLASVAAGPDGLRFTLTGHHVSLNG